MEILRTSKDRFSLKYEFNFEFYFIKYLILQISSKKESPSDLNGSESSQKSWFLCGESRNS